MKPIKKPILYEQLTYQIIGIAQNIHRELGPVHKEIVYQRALDEELKSSQMQFDREIALPISYKGKKVGIYRTDFLIDNKVIVEIKALEFLPQNTLTKLSYYLKGTDYRVGLLLNFGTQSLQVKRRIYG